jgi:hypothetical protein
LHLVPRGKLGLLGLEVPPFPLQCPFMMYPSLNTGKGAPSSTNTTTHKIDKYDVTTTRRRIIIGGMDLGGAKIRPSQSVTNNRDNIIISFLDLLISDDDFFTIQFSLSLQTAKDKRAEERHKRLVDHDDSLHFFPFVAGKRSKRFHFAFCSRKRPAFCRSKRVGSLHEDYRRVWCIWFDR